MIFKKGSGGTPPWKISFLISLVLHVLAIVGIALYSETPTEKKAPFIARIVTPEELSRGSSPLQPPKVQPPRRSPRQGVPGVKRPPLPPMAKQAPQTALPAEPPLIEQPGILRDAPPGRNEKAITDPLPPREEFRDKGPLREGSPLPAVPGGANGKAVPEASSKMRERLFDREVVEKLAKREEKKENRGLTFDTNELRYYGYMVRLKEKIERIWRYPPEAAQRGLSGDLYIQFTIKKNGMLSDVELVRTSGNRSLDEAAIQALKDAQPFWPLPDEWEKDALSITGHFVYSIYGSYIR